MDAVGQWHKGSAENYEKKAIIWIFMGCSKTVIHEIPSTDVRLMVTTLHGRSKVPHWSVGENSCALSFSIMNSMR